MLARARELPGHEQKTYHNFRRRGSRSVDHHVGVRNFGLVSRRPLPVPAAACNGSAGFVMLVGLEAGSKSIQLLALVAVPVRSSEPVRSACSDQEPPKPRWTTAESRAEMVVLVERGIMDGSARSSAGGGFGVWTPRTARPSCTMASPEERACSAEGAVGNLWAVGVHVVSRVFDERNL